MIISKVTEKTSGVSCSH